MKNFIYIVGLLGITFVSSCGLKYTPPKSTSTLAANRQKIASDYIRSSYRDSSVTYQSLSFGQPTTIKPYIYEQLDSLYEVKYRNELTGRYDKSLDEKIANQKIVIQSSNQKVQYAEHHVYAIQAPATTHVYYADIIFNADNEVVNYQSSIDYNFPTSQLPLFKSYLMRESFIQSGYEVSNSESDIIDVMNKELDAKIGAEGNEYMRQMLNVFFIIKITKQVETKSILKNLVVLNAENRLFNTATDKIIRADSLMKDNKTVGYEIEVETPAGKITAIYSLGFELLDLY